MSTIRKMRLNNHLDTESACEKLDISKSMLYKIETGYRKPSRELIAKMSNIYGNTIDEIYNALPSKKMVLRGGK